MADGTVKEVEVPYDIPDSWEWVKLKEIALVKSSKRVLQKDYAKSGIPFYRSKEIGNLHRNEDIITELFITDEHYQTLQDSYGVPKQGDILITSVGSIGNTWICDERKFYYKDGNITQICSNEYFNSYFIERCIHSPFFWEQVTSTVSGTAYSALTIIKLNNILFPLPPLSEQKRIVEQIERALEKVDAYSESYNKLQELDKSFPDKLKKSILQYAMQGKLVPQDPNDEPVEVLLEKIQAEKQKLYEEGKLKKKDLAEIVVTKGDDNSPYKEVPYNIPKSWEWVRLGNISSLNFFSSISGDKIPNDSWVLDMEDIEKETGRLVRKNYKTGKSSYKSNKISFSKDTILYAKLRPNLKKVIISDENGFATTELLPIKVFGNISLEYIRYCMISPFYYFNIIQSVYGVKMPRVSSGFLNSTLLPLPPLTEQQRIVSKISQVFSVIESLV
ncbi:restriction endonuclease subunit S [Streptococcus entericus]|uniref:restriction endonuclease subunit S n=1 Tax=Streptococcus entericus TaxID=155680 RepID=UPI0003A3967F|nr:restriction endonuclease subunit S [Streptococcus entericus]